MHFLGGKVILLNPGLIKSISYTAHLPNLFIFYNPWFNVEYVGYSNNLSDINEIVEIVSIEMDYLHFKDRRQGTGLVGFPKKHTQRWEWVVQGFINGNICE